MLQTGQCMSCGGTNLLPARLEQSLAFHLEHDTRHAVRRAAVDAIVCRDCGYLDLHVSNPAKIFADDPAGAARVIQEEDF